MKYELTNLESLLFDSDSAKLSRKELEIKQKALKSEAARIQIEFVKNVFSLQSDRLIEAYIQFHQEELTKFLDRITEILGIKEVNSIQKLSFELQLVEGILSFIEKRFSSHFNLNTKVPYSYKLLIAKEFSGSLAKIEIALQVGSFKPDLISILLAPLKQFTQDKYKADTTYNELLFLKVLIKELDQALQKDDPQIVEKEIYSLLIYLNFNTIKLFNHYTDAIYEYAKSADSLIGRIEKLAYVLKKLNQNPIKPGFALVSGFRSLKEQLIDWVTEEIAFLEKRQQLSFGFGSHRSEGQLKSPKMNTTLSVSQLAFFIRVLNELEIVKMKSTQDLIRTASQMFTSKKTEVISPDSFKAKFYNPETGAIQSVKAMAIQVMNHINKTYKT